MGGVTSGATLVLSQCRGFFLTIIGYFSAHILNATVSVLTSFPTPVFPPFVLFHCRPGIKTMLQPEC